MSLNKMRTIAAVEARGAGELWLRWSDGVEASVDLSGLVAAHDAIGAPQLGDWGHSLVWPNGVELGADRLWLETLTATGHDDARQFLEWRVRHGLSLSKQPMLWAWRGEQSLIIPMGIGLFPKPFCWRARDGK